MITRDNIRDVFDGISKKDIDRVMDSREDYCLLEVGSYGNIYLSPATSFEVAEESALESGGIVCDKDDLLRLFVESGSKNPFLSMYL